MLRIDGLRKGAYLNWFKRLDPKKMKHKRMAAFDIETDDLLGAIQGIAFTSEDDYPRVIRFTKTYPGCAINFLYHICQKKYRGYIIYAHNLARFDASHIFSDVRVQNWLRRKGFEVHLERAFVVLRKDQHSWYLADSYRIWNIPLAKVMERFTPHKTKAPLPTGPFSWHDKAWVRRIEDDTLGLYECLIHVKTIVREHFRVPLSMTSPSTALRAARAMLPLHKIQRPGMKALSWLRAAYSGGRIEVFWQGAFKGNITVFDINSAYAWALLGEFPVGRGRYMTREPKEGYYIGRCNLSVPTSQHIPPVLSRMFVHAFTVGEFEALLTKEEVEFARKHGATVDVLECFAWKKIAPVFRDFIQKCSDLRQRDYAGALGQTVKLMQNGLYGILGLKMDRPRLLIAAHSPGRDWQLAFDVHTGKDIEGVFEKVFIRDTPNSMPHWAAMITARVRCRLTEFLILFERLGLTPLYAHTDSIWAVTPPVLPDEVRALITPDYGNLKIEAEGNLAYIFNPGEAALRTMCADDGEHFEIQTWKAATKGWKATAKHFQNDGIEKITQVQMFHMMSAVKQRQPGRTIEKRIKDYRSMRRRVPPAIIPGPTSPIIAPTYAYARYWSFDRWYLDKLRREPPDGRKYLQSPQRPDTLKVRWHRPVTSDGRDTAWRGQRRRADSRRQSRTRRRRIPR